MENRCSHRLHISERKSSRDDSPKLNVPFADEKEIILRAKNGDEAAKIETYKRYQRLVFWVAKKYIDRGLSFWDLTQAGNVGLFLAVDGFDMERGKMMKFSSYATWLIKRTIIHAIVDQTRTIRIPIDKIRAINQFTHTQRRLMQELDRNPTTEELIAQFKKEEKKGKKKGGNNENKKGKQGRRKKTIDEKVDDILAAKNLSTISLDEPVDDDGNSWINFIADKEEDSIIDTSFRGQIRKILDVAIKKRLTPREKKIIEMRFSEDEPTLEEIRDKLEIEITRQRVQQILEKSIYKLRNYFRKYFKDLDCGIFEP